MIHRRERRRQNLQKAIDGQLKNHLTIIEGKFIFLLFYKIIKIMVLR